MSIVFILFTITLRVYESDGCDCRLQQQTGRVHPLMTSGCTNVSTISLSDLVEFPVDEVGEMGLLSRVIYLIRIRATSKEEVLILKCLKTYKRCLCAEVSCRFE
jgi:hypothetical protein